MDPSKHNLPSSGGQHRMSKGRRITPVLVESARTPQMTFHGANNGANSRNIMPPPSHFRREKENDNDKDYSNASETNKTVLDQKWVERQRQHRRGHHRRSSSVTSAATPPLPPLHEEEEETCCTSSRVTYRQSMPSPSTSSPKRIQLSEMEREKLKAAMGYSRGDTAAYRSKNSFSGPGSTLQQSQQEYKQGSRRHSSHLPNPGATFVSTSRQRQSEKGSRLSAPESAVSASLRHPHSTANRGNYSPKRVRISDMEEEKRKARWTPQQGSPFHPVAVASPSPLEKTKAELQRAERQKRAMDDDKNEEQYHDLSSSSHSPSSAAAPRARVRLSDMEQEKRRAANPERECFLKGGNANNIVQEDYLPFPKHDDPAGLGGTAFWEDGKPGADRGIVVGGISRMEGVTPLYDRQHDYDDDATEYTTTPRWAAGTTSSLPSPLADTPETTVNAFLKEDIDETTVVVDAINVMDIKKDPNAISSRRFCMAITFTVLFAITVGGVAGYWTSHSSSSNSSKVLVLRSASPTIAPTNPPPTTSPTRGRLDTLQQVEAVSSWEDLHTPGTPAQRALQWILEGDEERRSPDDPRLLQRYILAVFYFATHGDRWTCQARLGIKQQGCAGPGRFAKPKFLIKGDECAWTGISCEGSPSRLVTSIVLIGDGTTLLLSGSIPSELGGLSELRLLTIANNLFEGTIPPELILGTKNSLVSLGVNNCRLSGPLPEKAFANHSKLDTLVLSDNSELGGTVPSFVSSLKRLSILKASNCGFSGTLSPNLGQLQYLHTLVLNDNNVTGTIPSELSTLPLNALILDNNRITGSIPGAFFNASWPEFSVIGLSRNLLTGTLPDAPESFSRWGRKSLEKRKDVLLDGNQFHGRIPATLSSIPYLKKLTLHGNNFTGNVSSQICNMRLDEGGLLFWTLRDLTADCLDDRLGSPNYVFCSCCTNCY